MVWLPTCEPGMCARSLESGCKWSRVGAEGIPCSRRTNGPIYVIAAADSAEFRRMRRSDSIDSSSYPPALSWPCTYSARSSGIQESWGWSAMASPSGTNAPGATGETNAERDIAGVLPPEKEYLTVGDVLAQDRRQAAQEAEEAEEAEEARQLAVAARRMAQRAHEHAARAEAHAKIAEAHAARYAQGRNEVRACTPGERGLRPRTQPVDPNASVQELLEARAASVSQSS